MCSQHVPDVFLKMLPKFLRCSSRALHFVPNPLPLVTSVNSLETKVACNQSKAQHGLMRGAVFFFLGRKGGGWFSALLFCSYDVPYVFPKGSPSCSQNVPNSISLLSHMVNPKFNSHVYKLKKVHYVEHIGAHLFLYCRWWSKEVLLLRSAQCSKKKWWWAQCVQKNCKCTHELINMDHPRIGRAIRSRENRKTGE
jgi:hypothetical protein